MCFRWTDIARRSNAGLAISLGLAISGCAFTPYEARHEMLSDSRSQIWLSEARQVKIRAAQSRVFEDTDRVGILEAIVTVMQDLGFQIDVLDEALGIVSGKKFEELESASGGLDPSYFLYNDESLLIFTKAYRTWGPFQHRTDMVRLTVTVRARNESQLIVRAAAQHFVRAVEDPKPYQDFFRSLEQALFVESRLLQ